LAATRGTRTTTATTVTNNDDDDYKVVFVGTERLQIWCDVCRAVCPAPQRRTTLQGSRHSTCPIDHSQQHVVVQDLHPVTTVTESCDTTCGGEGLEQQLQRNNRCDWSHRTPCEEPICLHGARAHGGVPFALPPGAGYGVECGGADVVDSVGCSCRHGYYLVGGSFIEATGATLRDGSA
jgi:hypothetical protein